MEITITNYNINQYTDDKFASTKSIIWKVDELDKKVIDNFPNLEILRCRYNKITSLEPLSNCVNLRFLICNNNRILSLGPLSNCINLRLLICYRNQIISLGSLSNCINLTSLQIFENQIVSLEPLSNCVRLRHLHCSRNYITSLEPLSNCFNLRELYCFYNQITSLEPLIYLRRLNRINYENNPIEIPTMQIQRMLIRINTNSNSSIYNNGQNVHDTEIQRTVCDSAQNLLKDPKNDFTLEYVINSDLNKSTIESIIEYCQDQTIHCVHLITYQELFSLVWNRIMNSIHKSELMKIMEE